MAAKHILVGTDFSEPARSAIQSVGEYARAHGSRVTLAYVRDPRAFVPPQAVLEPEGGLFDEENIKAKLSSLRDALLSDVDAETLLLEDHSPARALCEFAEHNDVDAIAVGCHGHGRIEHWLIGSVAERIVRHAHCNVFVYRS